MMKLRDKRGQALLTGLSPKEMISDCLLRLEDLGGV